MKLATVRMIGAFGLTLDVWFHWLEERNLWEFLVDDFFEAENETRWDQFLLGGDAFIRAFSVTAHVLLLTALLALIFATSAIRELRGRGLPLRFWRWWGGVGLGVDFVFHWLEQGSVADLLLDDFFEGSVFFRLLSLLAHIAFITATLLLILAPRVIDELRTERVRLNASWREGSRA